MKYRFKFQTVCKSRVIRDMMTKINHKRVMDNKPPPNSLLQMHKQLTVKTNLTQHHKLKWLANNYKSKTQLNMKHPNHRKSSKEKTRSLIRMKMVNLRKIQQSSKKRFCNHFLMPLNKLFRKSQRERQKLRKHLRNPRRQVNLLQSSKLHLSQKNKK
jgi:hypothetical protein